MTRHCSLCVGQTDDGFVIRVIGIGTSTHSPMLADFVSGCYQQNPDACVAVDLLACDYLDSTFLGCLLNLQRSGTKDRFQVVADDAVRTRLLAATQLDGYLSLVTEAPRSNGPFVKINAKQLSEQELGQHIMEAHEALAGVPSEVASNFRHIASQLKRELDQYDQDAPSLNDTVVLRKSKPK